MLSKLGRHDFRPAHLHIRINVCEPSIRPFPSKFKLTLIFLQAPGYEELITALFFDGPYITSDAVFGVKSSLIVVSFCIALFSPRLCFYSHFGFMLTIYSGTWRNHWSFDIESTRLQGTKTSCILKAWLCVGDSRWKRWGTKEEGWFELTELTSFLPQAVYHFFFSIRI